MNDLDMFHRWLHEDYPELLDLVTKWAICPTCRGNGTSTAYLGAYTQADREEMGDEWYEFMDDVRAGIYDRGCDACAGSGKVREVDEAASHPETVRWWHEYMRDAYEAARIEAQERRMGA
jgi:hypothetical protein